MHLHCDELGHLDAHYGCDVATCTVSSHQEAATISAKSRRVCVYPLCRRNTIHDSSRESVLGGCHTQKFGSNKSTFERHELHTHQGDNQLIPR
jgi:hypothetical protein